MDKVLLSALPNLTDEQKSILRKCAIVTIADLILTPLQDLAKKGRVSISEVTQLVQAVCDDREYFTLCLHKLEDVKTDGEQTSSIGDSVLDATLGGGLRPGMVWEIVGESAAGKTQFALQASLYVQLPPAEGGLGGSACYLTTSTRLQTSRLLQIQHTRQLAASLEDIHTLSTPTVPILLNILENQLPTFIESIIKSSSRKPVKLLIIDALAELFHSFEKFSPIKLVERSQQLNQISAHLHRLAHQYKIAVVVLNEVVDVFDNYAFNPEFSEKGLLLYAEQTRWFNRAHSVYGEDKKEASLGLVWANQVNARVMLARTGRRRYIEEEGEGEEAEKRQKTQEWEGNRTFEVCGTEKEATLIRRLTVVFNSFGPLMSCDYVVNSAGVKGLPSEDKPLQSKPGWPEADGVNLSSTYLNTSKQDAGIKSDYQASTIGDDDENYEGLWMGDEVYESIDWDSLEQTLSQSQSN